MKFSFFILLFCLFFFSFPTDSFAFESSQFITIVNPVRISSYNLDPIQSLTSQYSVVRKHNLSATWLVTSDVLSRKGLVSVFKSMDSKQEIGLFLEVSSDFAKLSQVKYNQSDSWHRSNSLFLAGYSQADRIKLIDTLFKQFKENFGYYPVSIGSWWIDSYSLNYMQKKYGVKANLGLADQFSTDGYQVWGTYFSTPFYPSITHSGIPANNLSNKINVVNLQWAPRDPLNGYGSGDASLFSTQDYSKIGFKSDYFEKLINLYAKKNNNAYGVITVGLEGDLPASIYSADFTQQMDVVKKLSPQIQVVTIKDFSNWYQSSFPDLSPSQVIFTDDLLGKNIKVLWYQSPKYRIGFIYDQVSLKLIDFRIYQSNFQEPYNISPLKSINLSINIPSVVDTVNNPLSIFNFNATNFELKGNYQKTVISLNQGKIILDPEKVVFSDFSHNQSLKILTDHPYFKTEFIENNIEIIPSTFPAPKEGLVFKDLSVDTTFYLNRTRVKWVFVITLLLAIFIISIFLFLNRKRLHVFILFIFLFIWVFIALFYYSSFMQKYFVSQSEIDGLIQLSRMPRGNVLVKNNGCLICSYNTVFPPAVYGNKRYYISEISKHPVVYDNFIFESNNRSKIKQQIRKINVSYIYLVKYNDYNENLLLSPGDYNAEKFFENANVSIWKVKN